MILGAKDCRILCPKNFWGIGVGFCGTVKWRQFGGRWCNMQYCDSGSGSCENGNGGCCTDNICYEGEGKRVWTLSQDKIVAFLHPGDCDNDDQCAGDLVCGNDNCFTDFGWPEVLRDQSSSAYNTDYTSSHDCCEKAPGNRSSQFHDTYNNCPNLKTNWSSWANMNLDLC